MTQSLFSDEEACGCRRWQCRKCNPVRGVPTSAVDFAADWRYKADRWLCSLNQGERFSSEDVTDAVGFPGGEQGMNRNNAVGAWIHVLARKNLISRVESVASRNPASNGATIWLWKKN